MDFPEIAKEDPLVTPIETDVERLRAAVRRRSAEMGYRTNTELAEAAGVKYRTLVNLLAGKATRFEDRIELALGWTPLSIQAVKRGGESGELPVQEALQRLANFQAAQRKYIGGDLKMDIVWPSDTQPVGLGLDAEADGLPPEDVEAVRAQVRALKRARGLEA